MQQHCSHLITDIRFLCIKSEMQTQFTFHFIFWTVYVLTLKILIVKTSFSSFDCGKSMKLIACQVHYDYLLCSMESYKIFKKLKTFKFVACRYGSTKGPR